MDQAAMLRLRDRLQAIEDELLEAGFDEFMVATDTGCFVWRTVARAHAEAGEEPPPPATRNFEPRSLLTSAHPEASRRSSRSSSKRHRKPLIAHTKSTASDRLSVAYDGLVELSDSPIGDALVGVRLERAFGIFGG
jgi:hypothetical protein